MIQAASDLLAGTLSRPSQQRPREGLDMLSGTGQSKVVVDR
jgi:hypothetical protein